MEVIATVFTTKNVRNGTIVSKKCYYKTKFCPSARHALPPLMKLRVSSLGALLFEKRGKINCYGLKNKNPTIKENIV